MSATKILKLSPDEIGRGAYGFVFRALDTTSGNSLAVKKSRVSIRIKRTLLHYEAKVLQRLSGHSAIPTLYGYGRLPHFEYLAMELGGRSVGDVVKQNEGCGVQVKTVILLALQMISALQHIHSHGLVHRDVKPDHMLLSLRDSSRIVFVDYGITCPRPQVNSPKRYDPELECRQVVGTLKWASLNAHNGLYLSWRDDLISLAYVLLFLLRGVYLGSLDPREAPLWCGSPTAGYPAEFGHFLDQAKDLEFDEAPPYERYMELFEDLYRRSGFSDTDRSFDWTPVTTSIGMATPLARPLPSQSHPMAKSIATGSWDSAVCLWDTTTRQQIGSAIQHDTRVNPWQFLLMEPSCERGRRRESSALELERIIPSSLLENAPIRTYLTFSTCLPNSASSWTFFHSQQTLSFKNLKHKIRKVPTSRPKRRTGFTSPAIPKCQILRISDELQHAARFFKYQKT
ncbi:kinase-like domain-containing protein [Melanogaster broomeanus]|nr:kinase-like domain-containing protein [Melanogaster broomeanus]